MSDSYIRIASGLKTAYQLLTTDSYLVTAWTRTSDMLNKSLQWSASQPDKGLQAEIVPSLGIGGGGYYGFYSGTINIFIATPDMRQYLFETLMGSNPIAAVTAYLHVPNGGYEFDEMQVVYGELVWPMASNAETEYTRFNNHIYHTITLTLRRARILNLEVLETISGAVLATLDGKYLATLDQT